MLEAAASKLKRCNSSLVKYFLVLVKTVSTIEDGVHIPDYPGMASIPEVHDCNGRHTPFKVIRKGCLTGWKTIPQTEALCRLSVNLQRLIPTKTA